MQQSQLGDCNKSLPINSGLNRIYFNFTANMTTDEVKKLYGNKIRVRACGLLMEDDGILLVRHSNIGDSGDLWLPPGGGMNYGESLEACLLREFYEETGLKVEAGPLKFVYQFIKPPFHAVEFFFEVNNPKGTLQKGYDPEMSMKKQIIQEVRHVTFSEISIIPLQHLHGIFAHCEPPSLIKGLTGLYTGGVT